MNKKGRGIGRFTTLIIVLFVLGLYYVVGQMAMQQQSYTYEDFIENLSKLEVGEKVVFCDGNYFDYECELVSCDSKFAEFKIIELAMLVFQQDNPTQKKKIILPPCGYIKGCINYEMDVT